MVNTIKALKIGMTEDGMGTGKRQEKDYWKMVHLEFWRVSRILISINGAQDI